MANNREISEQIDQQIAQLAEYIRDNPAALKNYLRIYRDTEAGVISQEPRRLHPIHRMATRLRALTRSQNNR